MLLEYSNGVKVNRKIKSIVYCVFKGSEIELHIVSMWLCSANLTNIPLYKCFSSVPKYTIPRRCIFRAPIQHRVFNTEDLFMELLKLQFSNYSPDPGWNRQFSRTNHATDDGPKDLNNFKEMLWMLIVIEPSPRLNLSKKIKSSR